MIVCRAIILLVLSGFLYSCSRAPEMITVSSEVKTITDGYPFAVKLKNQISPDAHLTGVLVDFDRQGNQFLVLQISYDFASPKNGGRIFFIAVDNTKHQAYLVLNAPNPLRQNPLIPVSTQMPIDLNGITNDIPGVLQIAKPNGLDEFCAIASATNGNVGLRLSNSDAGPIWSVIGDGWDDKGPIADLAISIDAKTAKVVSHSIQKAVNRQ